MAALHDDEIPIDLGLVRRLVDTQFPQYADLPLRRLGASGSTNALFRLGDQLLVRLPRQPGNGAVIEKEQRWVGEFARRLPVRVPTVLAIGQPARDYGERWSIVGWLPGRHPTACGPDEPPRKERAQLAVDLAEVIIALRSTPITDAAAQEPALRGYRGAHRLIAWGSLAIGALAGGLVAQTAGLITLFWGATAVTLAGALALLPLTAARVDEEARDVGVAPCDSNLKPTD